MPLPLLHGIYRGGTGKGGMFKPLKNTADDKVNQTPGSKNKQIGQKQQNANGEDRENGYKKGLSPIPLEGPDLSDNGLRPEAVGSGQMGAGFTGKRFAGPSLPPASPADLKPAVGAIGEIVGIKG